MPEKMCEETTAELATLVLGLVLAEAAHGAA